MFSHTDSLHKSRGYQSTRHTVISSRGHVITRSTRHRSTRHRHVSSHSQLVTSEHITKPPVPVVIILSACSQETSRNIARHGLRNYRYLCYFNVYCRLQITATDFAKSTVNSSQCRETWRSTRHTILRCDELTVWRVDWFPARRLVVRISAPLQPRTTQRLVGH